MPRPQDSVAPDTTKRLRPDADAEQTDVERDPYRTLFMRSADANLILDGDRFVDCNDAALKMLGYERKEDLFEKHPSELSPPTQPDGSPSFQKANEMIEVALAKGSHRFEWDHRRADGEVFPVEVLLTAVPNRHGTLLHVVWREITERRQLEEQLRHALKMEAVGKLAGGVAHDFNNLLMAILGNCDLLGLEVEQGSRAAANVAQIREAGTRAAELTKQLLAFSRKQVLHMEPLDLNTVIRDLDLLLRRVAGEEIALDTRLCDRSVQVRADRGQLEQVLVNLVSNARDATKRGGRVHIETRTVTLADDSIGVGHSLRAGHYAMLTVTDNGCGMSESVARRAFDPFFTTKPVGKGTGLGLSTVYGIVKQSGAEISLYSVPGTGTTVKVWFPLIAGSVEPESDRVFAQEPTTGSETVLVAEDEPLVASVMADILRDAGYEVLVAEDGGRAFELLSSTNKRVDLLLTDVVMPDLTGPELVRKAADAGYHPKVLYASGYAANALAQDELVDSETHILEKPFSARSLLQKVREVLDEDVC